MKLAIIGGSGILTSLIGNAVRSAGHQPLLELSDYRELDLSAGGGHSEAAGVETIERALSGADSLILSATLDAEPSRRFVTTVVRGAERSTVRRIVYAADIGLGATASKLSTAARIANRLRRNVLVRNSRTFMTGEHLEMLALRSPIASTILYSMLPGASRPAQAWDVVPLRFVHRLSGIAAIPAENLATSLVEHATLFTTAARRLVVAPRHRWISNPYVGAAAGDIAFRDSSRHTPREYR